MKKIYLATPYSGTQKQQIERFDEARRVAGKIIKQGYCVFSPICHSHPIAEACDIDGSHDFWKAQNESWLAWCEEVWIVTMPGWEESTGVKWEMAWAVTNWRPVEFIDPVTGRKDVR
jgi:hypothetical protein